MLGSVGFSCLRSCFFMTSFNFFLSIICVYLLTPCCRYCTGQSLCSWYKSILAHIFRRFHTFIRFLNHQAFSGSVYQVFFRSWHIFQCGVPFPAELLFVRNPVIHSCPRIHDHRPQLQFHTNHSCLSFVRHRDIQNDMVTLIPIFLWFSNVIFCLYYGICVCFPICRAIQ